MSQYYNYNSLSSTNEHQKEKVPNWANSINHGYYFQSSIEKYKDLVEAYGNPDSLINEYGGIAIWLNRSFYKRIELYDTVNINDFPYPHNNIICLVIHIVIEKGLVDKILNICANISYDNINNDIYIRCPSINYGNAILAIILLILNKKLTFWRLNNYPILKTSLLKSRLQSLTEQLYDNSIIAKYLKK